MVIVEDIEFRRRAVGGDDGVPSGTPWRDGRAIGPEIDAAVLEAAVQAGDGALLLFLTDDVPFEERLSIVLLSSQGELLDRAAIGGPYSTGHFSQLRIEGRDRLRFRFIGETDWSLVRLAKPRLALPGLGEPRGVSRPWAALKRHFVIEGDPQPQA